MLSWGWRYEQLSTYLITGGAGSLGQALTSHLLQDSTIESIRIYSRDEYKHATMLEKFKNHDRLRFLIGDIRDIPRLKLAMRGVTHIIHAAALKRVPDLEYNPFEAVSTNIIGTQNVIQAALDEPSIHRCVLISTDKAVNPVNLYGSTKMVAERLWIQANIFARDRKPQFSIVRYGNVIGSRGSVVPLFKEQAKTGTITITDKQMTRFWITLDHAYKLIEHALKSSFPGKILVPIIKSAKVVDIAKAIAPKAKIKIVGVRPGEKLHEELISKYEATRTTMNDYYVIHPETLGKCGGIKQQPWMANGISSNSNPEGFLSVKAIWRII